MTKEKRFAILPGGNEARWLTDDDVMALDIIFGRKLTNREIELYDLIKGGKVHPNPEIPAITRQCEGYVELSISLEETNINEIVIEKRIGRAKTHMFRKPFAKVAKPITNKELHEVEAAMAGDTKNEMDR